jgi:G3E family GTPase
MGVPVHIVAGFLGTGKTTLIRAQLAARSGENVAVIVNDFGEASLDGATLAEGESFRITSIPGGCVCCTAPEGFVGALGAVLEQKPTRIVIEPTGLARPQDLVDTVRRSPQRDALELGPVIVLVDPARLGREAGPERELVALQAGVADVLVANRTDLASAEDLARFRALAASLWPAPLAVIETTHGRIPREALEWPPDEGARLPRSAAGREHVHDARCGHAPSTAGFAARSWQWSPDVVFSRERLQRALLRMNEGLAGAKLARFKGIFRTQEGFARIEVAGGVVHEERSAHRRDSRADVIFESEGTAPFARVHDWLEGAALGAEERGAAAREIELALPDGRVRIVRRDDLAALPGGVADVGALFPKRSGAAARVGALWEKLGLARDGRAVVCAADGFASEPVPVAALCEGWLVHSLDGAALPPEQGGPFRLLIPADVPGAPAGCANVKGVVRIVVKT